MNENPDGNEPQMAEWTQQVTGRLSVEPVEDIPLTEHDEGLRRHR